MPKIIENLKDSILSEALLIIEEEGAEKLSIRKLSSRLGIAASTIYNYYPSKEHIVGEIALMRWNEAVETECMEDGLSGLERLSLLADNLKRLVYPVLCAHLTEGLKEDSKGHMAVHMEKMMAQLKIKVKTITGIENEKDLNVLTKLVAACMHDDELEISEIARIMKLI